MVLIVIISPAKKMRDDIAWMDAQDQPIFLKEANTLLKYFQSLTISQIQEVLVCSHKIAQEAYQQYHRMQLGSIGTPAVLSFDGIQYHHMAPDVFTIEQFAYVQKHIRILSGFYGVLKPMDHVMPYRFEVQDKIQYQTYHDGYAFWKDKIYKAIVKEDKEILDLASAQYSKLLYKYQKKGVRIVKCRFMEEQYGVRKEKGVYVKMARGEMVRWLAEEQIQCIDDVKQFQRKGYTYCKSLSNAHTFIFIRKNESKKD